MVVAVHAIVVYIRISSGGRNDRGEWDWREDRPVSCSTGDSSSSSCHCGWWYLLEVAEGYVDGAPASACAL